MTLIVDFGFTFRLINNNTSRSFSIPLLRKVTRLSRPRPARRPVPGRLSAWVCLAGIITSSFLWGMIS